MRTRSQGPATHGALDRIRRSRRYMKRYKSSDTSHRHRLKDRQRKSVRVVSHTRRN